MTDSFFTVDGDWFRPTDHCRGPWDVNACHAGPPTGLLARALEQLLPEQRLTRITVDLHRPIPFAGFRIEAQIGRAGRTVSSSEARLLDDQGRICAAARGLHMTGQPAADLPTAAVERYDLAQAAADVFPIRAALHGQPCFAGDGVEVRYPPGENPQPGPTAAWLRTVALLPDEQPSGFQRICPLADCGNAFSRNAEPWQASFVNPDLTVALHRDPVGDWLGSQSVSHWQPDGIGLADALLFDRLGPVGRALQMLLIQPHKGYTDASQ